MALPKHVGDRLEAFTLTLEGKVQRITESIERRESAMSVGIRALSTNLGVTWVGTAQQQPWPLAAGEQLTINITRLSEIHVSGRKDDKLAVLSVHTTGEASRPHGA